MTIYVTSIVRADDALEAELVAFLALPPAHRDSARLVECGRERFAPPERGKAQGWNVTFAVPTMTVAEAMFGAIEEDA